MSHFKVSNQNKESSRLLHQQDADAQAPIAKTAAGFHVAQVDTLLTFWPAKLVDLSHLVDKSSAVKDEACETLLVGNVVYGHAHEAAVVVVASLQAFDVATASETVASKGLSIVGSLLTQTDAPTSTTASHVNSSIWLTLSAPAPEDELPLVVSVRFAEKDTRNGRGDTDAVDPRNESCAVNIIGYSVPNSRMLQYFALESLRLAPVSGMKLVSTAAALLVPDAQLCAGSRLTDVDFAPSTLQNKFLRLLHLDPVHWRSFRSVRPEQGRLPRGTALRGALEVINRLQAQYERLARPDVPSSTSQVGNGAIANQVHDTKSRKRPGLLARVESSATWLALTVQATLRCRIYSTKEHAVRVDGVACPQRKPAKSWRLTSVSAAARQLDVRISQLVVAPRLASRLRYFRKQQKLPIDEIAAPYIGLWNAIWLIANDIILGHAVSVLLLQYKGQLAQVARGLSERYLLESVLWLLSWLENWPAGLKLNTELSLFFSDAYSSLTVAWHAQGVVPILERLESVIVVTAFAGRYMGVTMVLCLMQDLVSICTLHITVFYGLSLRTLDGFVYVLSSLFDVFRGKKRNALRGGRLDDARYELDQLLLGTLLFTLVAFLFPTVYVYYLAFGLVRFGLVAFEAGTVETCLGLLNHLPLFALMLRVKDPHRLPAGVWLQEVESLSVKSSTVSDDRAALEAGQYILRSRPLAVSDIFEGYGQHVGGLVEVLRMLLRCLLGRSLRSSE